MKRIVSISIGSSKRDSYVETELLGEKFTIERIGTDGNMKKAISLIRQLDGNVEAFGMGGIDLYLWAAGKRYTIREALPLKKAAKTTPIVDGSGVKNTLERRVIEYLSKNNTIDFKKKTTLITCALDRFGIAEAIDKEEGKLIIGDLIFALGLDLPIYKLQNIQKIAKAIAPIVCKLPFKMLYPTGNKQNQNILNKIGDYYSRADIIAGDFHYIKRYMPQRMEDKIIITNTVTKEDCILLKERGVAMLITTTPRLGERSFGTNVMEAILVSIMKDGNYKSYDEVIEAIDLRPRIEDLRSWENT
ncbi:MAG: quinate 5-dehydrogenase [Clostridiaceae bacterium]|nr:quinate 5-dehydrogenase [Clostridiaceae bacterium]